MMWGMDTATQIVQQLDAQAIRVRLEELESERKALLVLLRAALAKQRSPRSQTSPVRSDSLPDVRG